MLPLSTYELRVLKAVDDRPGGTTIDVIRQMTDYSEPDTKLALSILEHDKLVTGSTVERTGTTWWRSTRLGRDRLIITPAPRCRRRRVDPRQIELGAA